MNLGLSILSLALSVRDDHGVSFLLCAIINRLSLGCCHHGNGVCCQKDIMYKHMAQFWGRIFLLSFAVGVVTGIIQEFQFGMNWSDYSRFMGDILGRH